ncbi:PAS domain S-box-containing protein [Pseudomonas linyingensis]|uniref:Sensory/regulatory protein RpfC n=1 Tax=Pseudomonas linyingensis TaxID=915471 RepID=A0A1H6Z762_9PSED|nr:PAS domain S-box protein [Pseudomonas linyingensis]SEJ49218.1 PAS domain S-box-containing protein [Pseudomonas linyingensis]
MCNKKMLSRPLLLTTGVMLAKVNLRAAGLYVLAGMLGILLAQSTGYAVPVWPAAGMAVAVLLAWGQTCWPGLWLGGLLIEIWLEPTLSGAGLGLLTTSAATTQALLGAWLARLYLQGSWPFSRDFGLALSLVSVGPLTCLVAPTLGTVVLVAGGRIASENLFSEWLLWWVGDSLGVLLFAPLIRLLWPGKHPFRLADGSSYRFAMPLIVTSALLTTGHIGLAQLEDLRAGNEAHRVMEAIGDDVAQEIAETLLPLEGLAHFLVVSKDVSREAFHEYSQHFVNRAALLSVDWAPRVTQVQRGAFEASMAAAGFAGFRISELDEHRQLQAAAERPEYYPIVFTEPSASGGTAVGLDHAFEKSRRQAMELARYHGRAITSEPIHLVRSERQATLVFIPVWRFTQGQLEEELNGYVVGVIDIEKLFAPLLAKARNNDFGVRIADITPGTSQHVFIDRLPAGAEPTWHRDLQIEGRIWRLEMASHGPLRQPGSTQEERLFLGFSMATAFLAVFATLGGAGRQVTVTRQVNERTAQLHSSEERYRRLIELSPFGILVQCEGRCAFVNASALTMFGARSEEEILERPLLDFIHPNSHGIILDRLTRRAAGEPIRDAAVLRYLRLDGSSSWVEITSAAYQYEGRPGSLLLLNDISARIHAEEQRDRIFSLSLDLLCIVGNDGYFQTINPAFTRTLGWSEEEFLSRPLIDFVHPDDVEATQAEIARLGQGEKAIGFENRYRCKGASWRWLAWKAVPQPGGLMFLTAHDTTTQHRHAEQLGELNAQLQQRVAERSRALTDLQAKEEEIRAVLDHLLECVVTIDSRGIVQSVNPSIEPLFGYTPAELIGRNVSMLMPPQLSESHDDGIAHAIARYRQSGERHVTGLTREVTGRHKDGHAVDLEISVSEYHVHGEHFFVGTLRGIRERKVLIASLTQARKDAEQASRAKSAFLAAMSHEIRTPMNGVIGLIDVLSRDRLPPHQADLVMTIRDSANTLLAVIDDILDFSKIEAGRLEIEQAPVPLVELIESLCGTLGPLASSRGVTLEQDIAPEIPRWVRSDAIRLRQILYNLIGNAIKFSGGRSERLGQVVVRACLAGSDPLRVAIAVEDNGIGIAPEHKASLFSPFTQAESSTTRRFGGSGLGLAICKRLATLMDGEITVASTPGSGSIFTITLPLIAIDAPSGSDRGRVPMRESAMPTDIAASRRILVVEDETVNRKVIQQQLTLLGYRFEMACHGVEALAMWRLGGYDLVLSDLHMPEMDGYQLAACIRREEGPDRHIPILALTANALRDEAARARAAGMDDYLTKPILLNDLEDALFRWLHRKALSERNTPSAADSPKEALLLDPNALTTLVGDTPQMIREILGDYSEALSNLTPQLQEHFAGNDLDAIGALVHRLKSSSRAVGAARLGQLCAALEQATKDGDDTSLARGIAEFPSLQAATVARIEQFLLEKNG